MESLIITLMPLCIDLLYHSVTVAPFAFDNAGFVGLKDNLLSLRMVRNIHEVGGAGRSHDLWLVIRFLKASMFVSNPLLSSNQSIVLGRCFENQ